MVRLTCPVLPRPVGRLWLPALIVLAVATGVHAKAPGKSHCYRSVCVKVLTVQEVRDLLGKTVRMTASHYGDPSVDPFNRGTYTSNGEKFNAGDPTRTASATLPDGTELLLRNPATGAVSHVRVNDFGPFWVNRELDVTEQVARDLGFEKQGIKSLEVTIVSVPTVDDVKRLYRHNRPQVPAMGFLGTRTEAETVKLAHVLMRREGPTGKMAQSNSKQRLKPPPIDHKRRVVVREHVYHFVPKLAASPRALGAEDFTPEHEAVGKAALARWSKTQQALAQLHAYSFAVLGSFLLLAFMAPYSAPLVFSGIRKTHRFLTYDEAVEHLKHMLAQPHSPARTLTPAGHHPLLWLPSSHNEHRFADQEVDAAITEPHSQSTTAEIQIAAVRSGSNSKRLPTRHRTIGNHRHRPSLLVRFDKLSEAVPFLRQRQDLQAVELGRAAHSPRTIARIIGEGVCHEGDLSSSDAVIVSGRVIGTIRSAQVTVEPTGLIEGDVIADRVRVEGQVNGSLTAQKVDLEPTALVSGDVRAKIINSKKGALIEGQHIEVPLMRVAGFVPRL